MANASNEDVPLKGRGITYADEELGIGAIGSSSQPNLRRRNSIASIQSGRSGRLPRMASLDPIRQAPILYRTMSFGVAESQERERTETHIKKEKAVKDLADLEWHSISPSELYTRLSTSPEQGLSNEQAKRRIQQYGRNIPSAPPSRWWKDAFSYFFGGFGSILLIASILVFISWKPLGDPPAVANLALAIVLLAVFFIQAAFNAWQDWSSSKVMASITTMLPDDCLIVREGHIQTITAPDLVPGDLLHFKAGNKLPADIRFVEVSSDAKFDRSILTGESQPVPGSVGFTDENYLETYNIGLQGTHCIMGSGKAIVVSTGDETVFGRIAKLTSTPTTGMSTLQKEILRFSIIIVSLMLTMVLLVIIVWATWLRKEHPDWINVPTLIVCCVSVAVAFIPEGLPVALTASLTITANLMRKHNILCKSLRTLETLGSVSVICSDKTGTLTKNNMTVTECAIGPQRWTTQGARDAMIIDQTNVKGGNAIAQLRALAGLCNAGEFDVATQSLPLASRKINGDATDQAVLRFSESLGSTQKLRQMWKKVYELAFNSKNKFMIRLLSSVDLDGKEILLSKSEAESFSPGDFVLTIKGAPDVLIDRCSHYLDRQGDVQILDDTVRAEVEKTKNQWSREGKRVILLARRTIPKSGLASESTSGTFENEIQSLARDSLIFVGLVAIVDPPRDEIPNVVRTLRGAGIRIFMVTGDFALTAAAIARECGIISNNPDETDSIAALSRSLDKSRANAAKDQPAAEINYSDPYRTKRSIVLSGPELISLNDAQWTQLCAYDEIVFARTTPEQKLRIVKELQSREHIVGMTGDGVNDAPSLKAADIGISLGSGSDIAIEASDMVLLDSFDAIVQAVSYGRVVFDNLKKTIAYLLPAGSFAEFWPVITNVIFGLPQILSSFLMIIICCFTDCAAATALAYEKPEADVLLRPPRRPKKDKLVDPQLILQSYGFIGVLETLCSFSMSYWYLQRKGIPFSALWFKFGAVPENVTEDFYAQSLNEASSIYFVTLVVMQWFNLLAIRTRRLSIFQHPPLFNSATQNKWLFPAILFSLLMAVFWLYIPALQRSLGMSDVPVEHWFLPMAFGMVILGLDEGRKFFVRKGYLGKIAW